MSRICIVGRDGFVPRLPRDMRDLRAAAVRYESELQKFMRDRPELLPLDDFGLEHPFLVVGMENRSIDLLGLTRSGEILLFEFKTGPKNQDFRSALAQLFEYGSVLFQMLFRSFETEVAGRYFRSDRHCTPEYYRTRSLEDAFYRAWPTSSESEFRAFSTRLADRLSSGSFHFVVVAQSITPIMKRTVDYLNTLNPHIRFYLVEMSKLRGPSGVAFKARTARKPKELYQQSFVASLSDDLRDRYANLFARAEELGLILDWGEVGMSIRLIDYPKPLSVAWAFPPSARATGGMGQGFTFGYREDQLAGRRWARRALDKYVTAVSRLHGAERVTRDGFRGYNFGPDNFGETVASQIEQLLIRTVSETSGSGPGSS